MANRRSNRATAKPLGSKTTLMDRRVPKKPNKRGSQPSMYPKGKYPA